MKVFWAIVALLVAVGVGVPAVRSYQRARESQVAAAARQAEARSRDLKVQERSETVTSAPGSPAEAAPTTPPPSKSPEPAADTVPSEAQHAAVSAAPVPTPVPTPVPAVEKPAAADPAPPAPKDSDPSPASPPAPDAGAVAPAPEAPRPAETAPKPEEKPTPEAPAKVEAPGTPAPAAGVNAGEPPKAPASAPVAPAPQTSPEAAKPTEAVAAKIVKRDDGTMLVDDKFVVKGEGSKEKPYEVSWDMLVSAQESYEPRQGRKRIPERLSMLNDKYVRITGYIAFPMFVDQPKELLSMLNQWDGCCIGVPPTPYDAVEVHLSESVEKDQRASVYGVVTGKFGVKPYLAGDWLVGLYIMENASFESKGFGGT